MYRIVLGKVSTLSAAPLPPGLREQAPQGPRRERWLAGRALLSHTLSPLPEIIYGEQGKPAFAPETPLWFNLSHSGDDIALLLSDEGEVGCDIEVIRPRANWRWLANAVFSLGEHAEMDAVHPDQQLEMFWRIWTRKEAIVKQRGGSARQEPEADPHAGQVYINDGFNMVWMTPHEGIPASGLAQEDFRRDTNDDGSDGVRVRYLGAEYATRWGVDVSNHQGTIDWAALKRQGIDFAYLRLGLRGYGEKGSLYPDRSFDSYYSGARAAGIDVGVYFFSQAATVQEAAQEALYALQLLDGRDLDLPVYYDWEPVQQEDSRTLHNNEFLLTSQARTFCALIEQGGYEAGVYMNRQQGYYRYDLPSMGNIALWIADPGDYPDFYYRFDVWQYDHGARLDGVNEIVDLNVEFVPVM